MAEVLANSPTPGVTAQLTALGGAINSTSTTSLTAAGSVTGNLLNGSFRILVGDGIQNGGAYETMLVTAGQSSTSWTVIRGSSLEAPDTCTSYTWNNGTPIFAIITAAGILAGVANKRYITVAQSATPAINTDLTDIASITALAQAITSMTTNLTGNPGGGSRVIIEITDNSTPRAITWGASFESSSIALPTTTVASTLLTVGFLWNVATSKWRCVGVA